MWGPKPKLSSLEHQSPKGTQITTSGEKQQGCSGPQTDGWRCKGLFKGLKLKFSCAATYPGLQQIWGQSGLEMPEERLETEALGRDLRE